MHARPEQH
jgi:hypothetical protein